QPPASYQTATFVDLKKAIDEAGEDRDFVVLDVRRGQEYDESHIDGAVNVPIHTVLAHLDSIPRTRLGVHCAAGYRASVVASTLEANGHDVVAVDDDYNESAKSAGLPLVA